jgi:hypothetical protein
MHGVTTALVGYLLVCVIFPNLIKNRAQYYAAFAAVCLIIVLDALGMAVSGVESGKVAGLRVFAYVVGACLQVGAILMLFLASGGLTWRELADDMKDAVEVIRRGGDEKEIIVPLSGEMARMKAQRRAEQAEPAERERYVINDPAPPTTPPSASAPPASTVEQTPRKPDEPGGIPLEP